MDKSRWVQLGYSWLGITLLISSESSLKEVSYIYILAGPDSVVVVGSGIVEC